MWNNLCGKACLKKTSCRVVASNVNRYPKRLLGFRSKTTLTKGVTPFQALRLRCKSDFHSRINIEPNVTILSNPTIGESTTIGSGTVIGEDVSIGEHVTIGKNVTLENCTIGNYVTIKNGASIGQDGFGWIPNPSDQHIKKPQTKRVQILDHVEIGANTCIDRGSWRDTIIGEGSKLDNLIAHNVQIGKKCLIAGQSGIAGSTTIGDNVFIGGKNGNQITYLKLGQTGIIQHLKIGNNVKIASKSGVTNDIPDGATYGGAPAVPIREHHKQTLYLRKTSKNKEC